MNFDQAVNIILRNEGGYTFDPNDPGGETNFGISKRYFPDIDIKNLTENKAKDIYFNRYWMPMKIEGFTNDLLKLHVFDMGVNAGPGTAIMLLQDILNIEKDGINGPKTITAANNYQNQDDLSQRYALMRVDFYKKKVIENSCEKKFLIGWINRVNNTTDQFKQL